MRKLITTCLCLLVGMGLWAAEAEGNARQNRVPGTSDVYDYTHWSLSVNGGMSQFDGDVFQRYNQLLSESHVSWTAGLEVQYTFNPLWGVAARFQYAPMMGTTSSTKYGKNYLTGEMFMPTIICSLNMINALNPFRPGWRWNMYLNVGLGVNFYHTQTTPDENNAPDVKPAKSIEKGRALTFPVGLTGEYNINRTLAVGAGFFYHLHNKDNFEGEEYTKGVMNDGEWYVNASLRVKFAPNKKIAHMRNLAMADYQINHAKGIVSAEDGKMQDELDSLKHRVAALEDTLRNSVLPRLDDLEQQHAVEPDEDNDGVPDFRDREPNTPSDSFVNYWGESMPRVNPDVKCCEEVRKMLEDRSLGVDLNCSVYFANDKYNLTKTAKDNIARCAEKLRNNPDMKVEIRGYCDATASKEYNWKLSENRVKRCREELIKVYGVDPSRISTTPRGKLVDPPHSDFRNRKCDFFFHY